MIGALALWAIVHAGNGAALLPFTYLLGMIIQPWVARAIRRA